MSDKCPVCDRAVGHDGLHRRIIEWDGDLPETPNPEPEVEASGEVDLFAEALNASQEPEEPEGVPQAQPAAAAPAQAQGPICVNGVWIFPDPVSPDGKCIVCEHRAHRGRLCPHVSRRADPNGGPSWEIPCDCPGD